MHSSLFDEVARHFLAPFVIGGFGIGQQLVEFVRLDTLDVVQPFSVALHLAVGVCLLLELATLRSRTVEQVT